MKKTSTVFSIHFFVIILLFSLPALSAPPQDLSGHWEGFIKLPGTTLEFNLDFVKQADASLTGDISIPQQGAVDLPLAGIKIEGTKAMFAISGIPGDPTFDGTFSADGLKMSGKFTQSGQTFTFEMTKGGDPLAAVKKSLEGFDEVVSKGLEQIKVPGAAVAVVKNTDVVFARGFGYRDVESKLPMTADTLLAIGSSSKAFTTFALGTLVDAGKLEWDKPLRNYIPWFRLYDVSMGERLTPRDLVTHRSGLPRHDLVWYNNFTATREELVRRLAYLQPTADLRERFQYNNLMFLTAGYLVEVLTGNRWEDSVRALVFDPLEMKRSNFSVDTSRKDGDFAQPYREEKGKFIKIPFRNITTVGPAGSINSTATEMSHWVMTHLNQGKYKDRQVVAPLVVADMHTAYMTTGGTPTRPDISVADYGLGWFTDVYRGHVRVHHGGNIDGFSALVSFFPRDGLGFVVLTNKNGTGFPELVVRTAADRILGLDSIDWIGDAAKQQAQGEDVAEKAEQKKATRRIPGTTPAHKVAEYAGDFSHPGYGDLEVTFSGGKLSFSFNGIRTPLEHWHYETFNGGKADDPTFRDMKLTFQTDVNGNVASVSAPFEAATDEIVFEKKPDAKLFDPQYLGNLTGAYDLASQRVTISLKGNSLTLLIPGQPVYDLIPEVGGEFSFKQAKVVTVRFIEDAKGQVTGLEINQPGGVFEFKRIIAK